MATTRAPQEFQFVALSGPPSKDKKHYLTNIRKHVMHDYLRKQGKPNPRLVAGETRTTRSDNKDESSAFIRPRRSPKPNSPPATSRDIVPRLDDSSPLRVTTTRLMSARKPHSIYMSSSPGGHQLDPFDSLPVKQIPDNLMEWFPCLYPDDQNEASWLHRSNIQWAQNIWHSSTQDKGLFYTVLSQAERNRMVMTHSDDNRRYLFLRGQALQALRRRIAGKTSLRLPYGLYWRMSNQLIVLTPLSAAGNGNANSLILLIAYQIRFAIVEEDFKTAQTHLHAASLLIDQQGEEIGPFVLVHATLMDVKLAAAGWTRPILKFKDPHLRLQTSSRLAHIVWNRTQTSLAHFPHDFRDAAAEEAMTGLHWHFLKFDKGYGSEVGNDFSVLLNCVRTARHLRGLAADAWDETNDGCNHERVRPRIAIIFCIEYFAWMHDPAQIIPWISHSQYMECLGGNVQAKLQKCLDPASETLEEDWHESGASSHSLLWILMIGFVISRNNKMKASGLTDPSHSYLKAMRKVMRRLQIFDHVQLEQALRMFPWTENLCGTWSKSVVAELGLSSVV